MASKKNDIIDIDLSVTKKKRFRVDGDNNRILELNTSDMSILSRLSEVMPKLTDLSEKITAIGDVENGIEESGTIMKATDTEMRELIDYLFDSKVSDVCAPDGSMYDLFNGEFRFEHILERLFALYEDNIEAEYTRFTKRISKHTDKYTKKK